MSDKDPEKLDIFEELPEEDISFLPKEEPREWFSAWKRGKKKKTNSRDIVIDLIQIRESVKSLLKIHGIPRNTSIELANMRQTAHGMAGFRDGKARKQPFILLDKSIYNKIPGKHVQDVYNGVGIHEASHLNHSNKIYERIPKLSRTQFIWENLLEDERIEQLAREESPGFDKYVQVAKKYLCDGASKAFKWDVGNDLDKIRHIIYTHIRSPDHVREVHKTFKTIEGENVLETVKKSAPRSPRTEGEVSLYSDRIELNWKRWEELYKDLIPKSIEDVIKELETLDELSKEEFPGGSRPGSSDSTGASSGEASSEPGEVSETSSTESASSESTTEPTSSSGSPEAKPEILPEPKPEKSYKDKWIEASKIVSKLKEAEKQDKLLEDYKEKLDTAKGKAASSGLSVEEAEKAVKDSTKSISKSEKEDTKIETLTKKIESIFNAREGERFGLHELEKIVEAYEEITEALDTEETVELGKVESERLEFGEDWECKHDIDSDFIETRKVVIVHPKPDRVKYTRIKNLVKGHVARMKAVFRLRLAEKKYLETELPEGKLHKRMLAKANETNRIFTKTYLKQAQGLAVCLLLDESGSMGGCKSGLEDSRGGIAARIAVLIAEALKDVPGIELEIYSYGSCGTEHDDCEIKYLYGKNNPNLESIAGYEGTHQNYDHVAIKTAGELFTRNTTNKNKLMVIMSDGAPCGNNYGGTYAEHLVKEEVRKLEKTGMKIINVAITSYRSEAMFKHVLKFLDLNDLINRMRQLIVRVVKQVS